MKPKRQLNRPGLVLKERADNQLLVNVDAPVDLARQLKHTIRETMGYYPPFRSMWSTFEELYDDYNWDTLMPFIEKSPLLARIKK